MLEQAGSAHIAQRPSGSGHGGVDLLRIGDILGNQHIADALTRQREGLGEGVAKNRVPVNAGDPGDLHTRINNLTVGLVRNQVDGMSIGSALLRQNCSQTL